MVQTIPIRTSKFAHPHIIFHCTLLFFNPATLPVLSLAKASQPEYDFLLPECFCLSDALKGVANATASPSVASKKSGVSLNLSRFAAWRQPALWWHFRCRYGLFYFARRILGNHQVT